MKKFLLLYKSSVSAEEMMKNSDPEAGKKMMEVWMQWFQKIGSAVVDGGNPTQAVAAVGSKFNDEGHIGGYSIIQAENLDKAKEMLDGHPHLMMDGNSIEVLEILPMPGM